MDRRIEDAKEDWDWDQNPYLSYSVDPEEIKEWGKSLPYRLEDVFDFNSGLGEQERKPSPPPPPDFDQREAIEKAAKEGDLSTVQRILDQVRGTPAGDYWIPRQWPSLYDAVANCHSAVVEYLLSQGTPPEVHLAKYAAENNDKTTLELLLRYGWDINEELAWSLPPVLGSVTTRSIISNYPSNSNRFVLENIDLVTWFLSHSADPNARCVLDITPLSYAVNSAPFEVIKTLFAHGGSINKGQLLHFAASRKLSDRLEVMAYLVNKGAPINDIMYQHDLPSTNLQEPIGLGTPLHVAARVGNLDVIRFLLEKGADLNIVDSRGQTVLDDAEFSKQQEVVDFLRRILTEGSHTDLNLHSGSQEMKSVSMESTEGQGA